MSDATPIREDSVDEPEGSTRPGKQALLADPVVRVMVYASIGLTVLFLATAVGVLATGVTAPSGPRSIAERELMIAAAQAEGASGERLAPYIEALISTGDLPAARVALAQARSVNATGPVPALDLAETRLLGKGKEYEKVISFADKAMKGFEAKYEARVATAGDNAAALKAAGYGPDYYNAALLKAQALVELGRWKDAVAVFDIYLRKNHTASDILIDRGKAKAELKDKVGAEKDFREALRYGPDNEEAQAGLKSIGVAP